MNELYRQAIGTGYPNTYICVYALCVKKPWTDGVLIVHAKYSLLC